MSAIGTSNSWTANSTMRSKRASGGVSSTSSACNAARRSSSLAGMGAEIMALQRSIVDPLSTADRPWNFNHAASRLQHHLDAFILLVLEDVVAVRRLVERQRVGDDASGIDVAVLDALEQRLQVALHMGLASLDGERAVHHRTHRKLVDEAAVHAGNRYMTAVAARHQRFAQRDRALGFQAHRLLHPVVGGDRTHAVRFHAD